MRTNDLIELLGWAALTYSWLNVNLTFFGSIVDAFVSHNAFIRTQAIKEYNDGKDESEDEGDVVCFSKSNLNIYAKPCRQQAREVYPRRSNNHWPCSRYWMDWQKRQSKKKTSQPTPAQIS